MAEVCLPSDKANFWETIKPCAPYFAARNSKKAFLSFSRERCKHERARNICVFVCQRRVYLSLWLVSQSLAACLQKFGCRRIPSTHINSHAQKCKRANPFYHFPRRFHLIRRVKRTLLTSLSVYLFMLPNGKILCLSLVIQHKN